MENGQVKIIDGKLLVEKIVCYARNFLSLSPLDEVYTRNVLLGEFGLTSAALDHDTFEQAVSQMELPDEIFNEVKDYAGQKNLC